MTTRTEPLSGVTHLLPQTNRLRALHSIVRDREARREDFVPAANRIIRGLLDAALDLLPYEPREVRTPVGRTYHGLSLASQVYGVSIARAGDSMESELRVMAPETRLGKILIQRDKVTKLPHLYYAALPPASTGATCCSSTPCSPPAAPRWPPSAYCSNTGCPRGTSSS